MQYRAFPRTDWQVAEIGYGTWGMAGWSGSDDAESLQAMERALALGCNFFDTAWAYGAGHSERLLRQLLKDWRGEHVYVATKVPPKNGRWPARADYPLEDVFPPDHIREMTEKSLENLGLDCVDLQQLHVWSDAWAEDERWQRAVDDLKREGLIKAFGISHQPLGAGQRHQGAAHRPRGLRAGGLQHLRPEPRGRAVPRLPRAERRHHRAGAVRRRQPDRHADRGRDVPAGRLAGALLQGREPDGRRSSASSG